MSRGGLCPSELARRGMVARAWHCLQSQEASQFDFTSMGPVGGPGSTGWLLRAVMTLFDFRL